MADKIVVKPMQGISPIIPPVILAFETSGMCGSVALVSDGLCIGEYSLNSKLTHSRRLLNGIERLMTDAGIGWDQIDALAVSSGPGSFTGLRIGLSTAKGLAMATGKVLIGVPTLDGLASQFACMDSLICPILDARKKEVYAALYRTGNKGQINRISEYMVIRPEMLAEKIVEKTVVAGEGAALYGDILKKAANGLVTIALPEIHFARAASTGMVGVQKWKEKEFLDPAAAVPIYVRPSDAELNFMTSQKNNGVHT